MSARTTIPGYEKWLQQPCLQRAYERHDWPPGTALVDRATGSRCVVQPHTEFKDGEKVEVGTWLHKGEEPWEFVTVRYPDEGFNRVQLAQHYEPAGV